MGAWGAAAFENDAAMDWVAVLGGNGAAAVTDAPTAAVGAEDHLDASEAEEAVAAAEVVAAALGQPAANLPDAVQAWVDQNPSVLCADHAHVALRAVERVNSDECELCELWVEDAEDPEWAESIADLRQRLEALRATDSS